MTILALATWLLYAAGSGLAVGVAFITTARTPDTGEQEEPEWNR